MIDLVQIRKELHQIPELAFEEYKTQQYIMYKLQKYEGLELYEFSPTGIFAAYNGGEGKYLLFRADMDALPLEERTGCNFASQHEGVMHACGHDMHITILLGLIDEVMTSRPQVNIIFVFQPAEEGKGGALRVLENPIWEKYQVKSAFALHVSPTLQAGEISSRAGNFFAATCEFDIVIKGRSAHIAIPEEGKNALQAGIELYQCVQQLPKLVKSKEKFICDFGVLNSGTARNTIPVDCFMRGTIRAEDEQKIKALKEALTGICESVAIAYGVDVEPKFLVEYKEVFNSQELVNDLKAAAKACDVRYHEAEPTMAGEDFGYFAGRWGGLLFWLGAADAGKNSLHNNHFLPDEKALAVGVKIMRQLINEIKGT